MDGFELDQFGVVFDELPMPVTEIPSDFAPAELPPCLPSGSRFFQHNFDPKMAELNAEDVPGAVLVDGVRQSKKEQLVQFLKAYGETGVSSLNMKDLRSR